MTRVWGIAWTLAAGVLLSACASHAVRPGGGSGSRALPDHTQLPQDQRYRLEHDSGPEHPAVDISKLPEPVPRVLPRSRYGNSSPYTVNGQTYYVLPTAKGYDQCGIASWYGNKFNGYLTSSMQRYDMYKFTAASKVLPLPTFVRVTNLANGKSVIVKVNDRGPFVDGRIIDLSYAAAVRIGIWPKGTGRVEVKAIDPKHYQELSSSSAVGDGSAGCPRSQAGHGDHAGHGVWLQVGSFADAGAARKLAARLRQAHLGPVHVSSVTVRGRHFTRVRLGPLHGAAVGRTRAAVEQLGLPALQVKVD